MDDDDDVVLLLDTQQEPESAAGGVVGFLRDKVRRNFSYSWFRDRYMNAPLDIRFRLTNKCDERCSRCFECSGPENPLDFMPAADVAYYHNIAKNAGKTDMCLTGGEWSLVYERQPHYLRDIFALFNISPDCEYTVQTNARWATGPHARNVINDLREISGAIGRMGGVLRLATSVDRWRSGAALDGAREMVRVVATDSGFKDTKIVLMGSRLDYRMANETVLKPDWMREHGVELKFEGREIWNPYFQVCYANNNRLIIHEEEPTIRIGRAAQNKFGYKWLHPEKQGRGLAGSASMNLSFREDGMVKWHDFYDWDIMVPYKDSDGNYKPVNQIRMELIDMAHRRRLRHNVARALKVAVPIVGPIYDMVQIKLLNKSFDENSAAIQWHVRKISEK